MRLIDGDKLLDWLDKACNDEKTTTNQFFALQSLMEKVARGQFDTSSNQREARLREALENIAFGRVEGDYSDARQYARGALYEGGNSDE